MLVNIITNKQIPIEVLDTLCITQVFDLVRRTVRHHLYVGLVSRFSSGGVFIVTAAEVIVHHHCEERIIERKMRVGGCVGVFYDSRSLSWTLGFYRGSVQCNSIRSGKVSRYCGLPIIK